MIDVQRYHAIRSRLIQLHVVITKRLYPVWVFPSHLMTTEQIRNRETYTSEDTLPDLELYDRPVERKITMVTMIGLLENVTDTQPLRVNNAHQNVTQIFETIQEYNSLWYELYVNNSNYGSIDPEEIKFLEQLSYYFFEDYRKIRLYLDGAKHRQQYVKTKVEEGMLGLMGLFGIDGKGNQVVPEEFVSYYDLLTSRVLPHVGSNYMPQDAYLEPARRSEDSLLKQQQAQDTYGIWGG